MQAMSNGIRLTVRVKPMSRETKLLQDSDGTLTMHVAAPPAKGKANWEILRWISKNLRIPSSRVHLVAGFHSKVKTIEIIGVNEAELVRSLRIEK